MFLLSCAGPFAVTLPKTVHEMESGMSDRDKTLALFKSKGKVVRKDIEKQLGCSKSVAVKILNALIDEALIEKSGEARAVVYTLK